MALNSETQALNTETQALSSEQDHQNQKGLKAVSEASNADAVATDTEGAGVSICTLVLVKPQKAVSEASNADAGWCQHV